MPTFKILALDGGGIRGVFTAALVKKLDEATGFLAAVDLFAGTSTGGLLALALANGLPPDDIVRLYTDQGPAIFGPRPGNWVARQTDGITRAWYSAGPLASALAGVFGNRTLGDLPRKVLVPAFDLDDEDPNRVERTWRARFFHNYPVPAGDTDDRGETLVDVALRTTAAPTYFPAADGYVDGGVAANSPAMAAVAQALDEATGGQQLNDLRVLALGTGTNHTFISSPKSPDWGITQWGLQLVDLFMDGAMGVTDYQCQRILGPNRYRRLGPVLPGNKAVSLDDVKAIGRLTAHADTVAGTPAFADLAAWVSARFK